MPQKDTNSGREATLFAPIMPLEPLILLRGERQVMCPPTPMVPRTRNHTEQQAEPPANRSGVLFWLKENFSGAAVPELPDPGWWAVAVFDGAHAE